MGAQLSLDKNDGSGGDFQELLPENHFKGFWSILLDKLGEKGIRWTTRGRESSTLALESVFYSGESRLRRRMFKNLSSRFTKSGIEHFPWVQPDSEDEEEMEGSGKSLRARELFMSGDSTMVTVGGG